MSINNVYNISFLIVVFKLIGKLLYLTLYQIVRYIEILFYIIGVVHNILRRIFL